MSEHKNYRKKIKACITHAGMSVSEEVEVLANETRLFVLWRGGGVGKCTKE